MKSTKAMNRGAEPRAIWLNMPDPGKVLGLLDELSTREVPAGTAKLLARLVDELRGGAYTAETRLLLDGTDEFHVGLSEAIDELHDRLERGTGARLEVTTETLSGANYALEVRVTGARLDVEAAREEVQRLAAGVLIPRWRD